MPAEEGERRAKSSPQDGATEGATGGESEATPVATEGEAGVVEAFRAVQDRLAAQVAGLQRAADEEGKRRQESDDMADFRRQLREVAAAKAEVKKYTVQPGDTLSAIALSQLGDAGRWPEIFQANGDKISNPNLNYPGQELTFP